MTGHKETLGLQDKLTVRLIQGSDAEELRENIYSQNSLEEVRERVASFLQAYADEEAVPLVAEVDGHVVGVIHIAFNAHPLKAHTCTLSDVVVNPEFQRKGIARRLFEESKRLASMKGKSMMLVSCRGGPPAETVYRRLGFIEYGRLPNGIVEPWGENKAFDEVLFYLVLDGVE